MVLAVMLLTYGFLAFLLPLPEYFTQTIAAETTKIYDRNGVLLYEVIQPDSGKKSVMPLEKIPEHLQQATLAAEDIGFYRHRGIDVFAVMRAVYLNLKEGRIVSGASTIPQQLVRTLRAPYKENPRRGWSDKLIEMAYAVRVSHYYSKDEVLELYLNRVYYGNMAYGVETAALDFFGKHVYDLDLAESALLAGLPQSPSSYNPFLNLEQARKRQGYVLDQMVKYGFVDVEEAEAAKEQKLVFRRNQFEIKAPHFVHYVINELEKTYGEAEVYYGGLKVRTTLDYSQQLLAERAIDHHLKRLVDKDVGNGALLAIDATSGEVTSWVGSADYFGEEIDGAVNMITSFRQPGSAIKPFTYLAAFEKGWTPATTIADIPTQFESAAGPYTPKNYDLEFHGLVRARTALASSYNIPAVKALDFVGVAALMDFLEKMGIDALTQSTEHYGLSLTLGGAEVRPLAMGKAYLALANLGKKKEVKTLLKVENNEGKVLFETASPNARNVLGPRGEQHAYQIIDILSDRWARLPGFGEGNVLELSRPAAVKTGTTRNFRDNWTIGFTPQLLTVVWVGNADGKPMKNVSGVDGAAPIWHDFMEDALAAKPKLEFKEPEGLHEIEICRLSGLLPTEECQERIFELFVRGEEPREDDNIFQRMKIDPIRNILISAQCLERDPSIQYEEKVFTVFPPELEKWALQNDIDQPPRERCEPLYGLVPAGDEGLLNLKVTHPLDNDAFLREPTIPMENQKIPFQVLVSGEVQRVEWWLDDQLIETVEEFPFSMMWKMEEGEHEVFAKDDLGNQSEVARFLVK